MIATFLLLQKKILKALPFPGVGNMCPAMKRQSTGCLKKETHRCTKNRKREAAEFVPYCKMTQIW